MPTIVMFHAEGEKNIELNRSIVRSIAFDVVYISDANELFTFLRREDVFVVVMNTLDIALIQAVHDEMPLVPICFAATSSDIEALWEYRNDPFFEWIRKPYTTQELLFFLKQHVQRYEQLVSHMMLSHLAVLCDIHQCQQAALSGVIQTMLGWVASYLRADSGSVMLLDETGAALSVVASVGIREHKLQGKRVPNGEGVAGWVVTHRQSLLLDETTTQSMHFTQFSPREDIHSSMSIVLDIPTTVFGVLNLTSCSNRIFRKRDFDCACLYAQKMSLFIERARTMDAITYENTHYKEQITEMDHFVRSSFHDLKTPLFTIQGFLDNLREHGCDKFDEQSMVYLNRIMHGTRRLERMITDVFEFFKYGTMTITKTSSEMDQLVDVALDELQIIIEQARATITRMQGIWPVVEGDKHLILRVWVNLISNAIKYGHPRRKPAIHVGFEDDGGDMVTFFVKDNGIGIDPKFFKFVFDVFARLREKHVEGTGMGLAIVKKIVTHHGGDVWLSSEKDKGTTFYFSLPKAKTEEF